MDGSSRNGPGGVNGSGMSRAERFEDEKRRIIDSCFGKKDPDGSLLESYITHIRIIEDAAYPSAPPPPGSNPDVKKTSSYHCRRAQVWTSPGAVPATAEEEQRKQWAGGVGFIVTIGKPYYWQANTQKEKQFFIASLVKIYTKYTGGKAPELIGFDSREREQLSGISSARPPPPNQESRRPPQPQQLPSSPFEQNQSRPFKRDPSREPALRKQPSRDAVQRPPGQMPPNSSPAFPPQNSRPPMRPQRDMSPNPGPKPTGVTPQQSQASLRRLEGANPSQESFGRSDDSGSLPPRSRNGANGLPNAPGRFPDRSIPPNSQRGPPESGFPSPKRGRSADAPPMPTPLTIPPERRRPPMPNIGDASRLRGSDPTDNIVPAPLASPGMRRDDMRPPTRSSERSVPREREVNGDTSIDTKLTESAPPESPRDNSGDASKDEPPPIPATAPAVTSPISPIVSPTTPISPLTEDDREDEDVRPGLGPMIKKKSKGDIASTFLRAAKNANGFKPRAGGQLKRLREAALAAKSPNGPDGITGVVPAPSLLRALSNDSATTFNAPRGDVSAATPETPSPPVEALPEKSAARKANPEVIPEVKITVPDKDIPSNAEDSSKASDVGSLDKPKSRDSRRPKSAFEAMQKELASLGIDPSFLDGRGSDIVNAWDEFGWVGEGVHTKVIDTMRDDVERELNKVQAGGWLNRLEEEDERVEAIKKGLDTCMDECDELDGLLTLYLVELGTLNEDIAYIEAQSQGLQVQTANQKLLQVELQSLLDTISISSTQLECLKTASLERPSDLEQIEKSLVVLFKAMVTIDPALSISGPRRSEDGSVRSGKTGGFGNSEIGSMRVLQEKKDVYRVTSVEFLQRLYSFLHMKFRSAIDETRRALDREKGNVPRAAGKGKLDPRHHDLARNILWNTQSTDGCRLCLGSGLLRKHMEMSSTFCSLSQTEKQTEGLATTTARKLTVKRSQTLAKIRSPTGDGGNKSSSDKSDGRLSPNEVFSGALDEMVPIMSMEQNFIVEFFHVTSLEQHDFADSVAAAPPDMRRGVDLRRPKVMDPNRSLAKTDWSLQSDPLQGVGILASIERKIVDLEESSQEYLARTLQKLHARLLGLFNKFLDEQIRAIEDTKVKIKKRKGVIGFIRIFPSFSSSIEAMLASSDGLEVRQIVNNAYSRLNKNYVRIQRTKKHSTIRSLLIENMNHYLEEVDVRSNPILEEWRENASQEMDEHMTLYLGAVIRRPLGKLLDFLESTESLMLSRQPGESASRISAMPSHSKSTFKKILAGYDAKEIRKGIETLKKRVEKHFGDADDPGLSRELVNKVYQQCERFYERVDDRILTISRDVYDGEVIAEWTRADISTAFRK
ncbi:hypothetical protein EYC84_003321 [Monilinia fructicola]|uniref:Exocyst complex component Sec3 PIP2-binding N-terminal domain-containing protein n=1 Tax=Monilinia fructicola TaxID=38448 RepID=A0A5M9JXW1_MONFR|nr:hypothetical protein EYC84_003321 [Monilinia fructicola]